MNRLKIRLSSGYLIEDVGRIPFEINNSFFDEELVRGTFTYGIDISPTPGNLTAFGFIQMPEVDTTLSLRFEDVSLQTESGSLSADLVILEAGPNGFKATLLFGWSKIMTGLKSNTLRDLDFGTLELVEDPAINNEFWTDELLTWDSYLTAMAALMNPRIAEINELPLGESDVCFPVFQDKDTPVNDMEVKIEGSSLNFEKHAINFKPWYFLKSVLQKLADKYGLTLEGSLIDSANFDRIILAPMGLMADREGRLQYGSVPTYPDPTVKQMKYPTEFELNKALPNIKCLDFLKMIGRHFFAAVYVDLIEKRLVLNTWDTVLNSTEILDWTDKVERIDTLKFYERKGFNFSYGGYNDNWASSAIKDLSDRINTGLFFPTDDYPEENVDEKTIVYEQNYGAYFSPVKNGENQVTSWEVFGLKVDGKKEGEGEYTREMILPSLDDWYLDVVYGVDAYSWFDHKSHYFYQKPVIHPVDDQSLRLSWWMGRLHEENDESTPAFYLASSVGEVNPFLEENLLQYPTKPQYSLFITEKEGAPATDKPGVYEQFGLRYWNIIKEGKKLTGKFRLSESDIMSLKPGQKIRIQNNLYLFDVLRANVPIQESTEVELYWLAPGI